MRQGWIDFLRKRNNESLFNYARALKIYRKSWAHRESYFQDISGVFHLLALLKKQDPTSLTHIEECAFQTRKSKFKVPFQCLQSAASYLQGELRQANSLLNNVKITSTLSLFFYV